MTNDLGEGGKLRYNFSSLPPPLDLAALQSLDMLSVFVNMGTCEESSERSQAPGKGSLPRGQENLLEFPAETAVTFM